MAFALVAIGLAMIITGAQNTYSAFATELATDFAAFIKWMLAIGAVGAIGYIPNLRSFSHYFMALILISMFLSNKGFFQQFTTAINAGPIAPANTTATGTAASAADTAQKAALDLITPSWYSNLISGKATP
jgi:hypothetical protein